MYAVIHHDGLRRLPPITVIVINRLPADRQRDEPPTPSSPTEMPVPTDLPSPTEPATSPPAAGLLELEVRITDRFGFVTYERYRWFA